jgi:hypothetical protein
VRNLLLLLLLVLVLVLGLLLLAVQELLRLRLPRAGDYARDEGVECIALGGGQRRGLAGLELMGFLLVDPVLEEIPRYGLGHGLVMLLVHVVFGIDVFVER